MVLHDHPSLLMASHGYAIDTSPAATGEEVDRHNDDLDDVFGSEPASPSRDRFRDGGGMDEVSDIPRLREKHETEGYRDGVTQGKAKTVQQGFDEGYNLGAVLGLRIGRILGVLEGVAAAVRSGEGLDVQGRGEEEKGEWKVERERMEGLMKRAREELKTESVFGREWWGEDGIWMFDVPGEGEGMDVVFTDVASAHPLIKKWEAVVDEEVKRWGLNMAIMENELELETKEIKAPVEKQEVAGRVAPGAKKELSW